MSLKVVLAPLYGSPVDDAVLQFAGQVAAQLGAHVDAFFADTDPLQQPLFITSPEGAFPYKEWYDAMAELNRKRRQRATEAFDRWLSAAGIARADAAVAGGTASASLATVGGPLTDVIGSRALTADLVVAPLPGREADSHLTAVEVALFQSGRPVLLAPAEKQAALLGGGTAVVAWKECIEAAHALSSALPLLQRARETVVLQVNPSPQQAAIERVLAYLKWHGVNARPHSIESGEDAGVALLAEAQRLRAGLLVLGAYSHSRAREVIFGGVTRHVLREATLPVWFAR
jgi:nucleotide-binding universal stress UspA family protein